MSNELNGITFMMKFVENSSRGFANFLEYIDREEAYISSKAFINESEFEDYVGDYMDNPEKTFGIFTNTCDNLTNEEKKNIKTEFKKAQKKGSLLWQQVFSFDNNWLLENGLYNRETNFLDEATLRRYTRKSIDKMLKDEKLENAIWTASIHKNTDNFHIHIAMVDPNPIWQEGKGRCKRLQDGRLVQKGTFKSRTRKNTKSIFASNILNESKENKRITEIMRENILANFRLQKLSKKKDYQKMFKELLSNMPEDKRLWYYNKNAMKENRKYIDEISKTILNDYYKKEYEELLGLLDRQQEKYSKEVYGKGTKKENRFKENRLDRLFQDMGNAIIKELKEFDRMQKTLEYEKASKEIKKKKEEATLMHGLYQIKRATMKSLRNIKNQQAYQQLLYEQERGGR